MAKHLGGVIHLVDHCTENPADTSRYHTKSINDIAPTFRPQLSSHLLSTKTSNPSNISASQHQPTSALDRVKKKRSKKPTRKILGAKNQSNNLQRHKSKLDGSVVNQNRYSNRRMDYETENYDYMDESNEEVDYFDEQTREKLNKCKAIVAKKERKIDGSPSDLGLPTFEHFPIRKLKKDVDEMSQRSTDQECREMVQRFVNRKMIKSTKNNLRPRNESPEKLMFAESDKYETGLPRSDGKMKDKIRYRNTIHTAF